ncbi:MAG: hypothetical protein ACE5KS_05595 [Woeseiaceae bacterium]
MKWVIGFAVVFGLCVVSLIRSAMKAGKRELSSDVLARARTLLSVSPASPGAGWQQLGQLTTADGLNLKFDHDDDPQAEAMLLAPGVNNEKLRNSLANNLHITLEENFRTFHVHTDGYVFRIRARGTGKVVGKQTCLKMAVNPKTGEPIGGKLENDDDIDAAVGDWIEIESAEILQVQAA